MLPAILDDAGGILAYGRSRRLASPGQRRALFARDRGCTFPGCDRTAAQSEIHHTTDWATGGHTDLDTMAIACGFHNNQAPNKWLAHRHDRRHPALATTTLAPASSSRSATTSTTPNCSSDTDLLVSWLDAPSGRQQSCRYVRFAVTRRSGQSPRGADMRKSWLALAVSAFTALGALSIPNQVAAADPQPSAVSVPGSFGAQVGCPGDWQPDCAQLQLTRRSNDDVWSTTLTLKAGSYEYKAALNKTWDVNYGAGGVAGGPNIPLSVPADGTRVTFYYDNATHWVTSDLNNPIVTAAGDFQSELGCPSDWSPDCLRSWLQDPDGDGTYTFTTTALPAGDYQVKATVGLSWDVNYGAGGVPGGANIDFSVPADRRARSPSATSRPPTC